MSRPQELKGPDFGAGLDAGQLRDGEPLLGHAAGEPVVLVRRGSEICAVGAVCSHYGGPLAEGIVEGGTWVGRVTSARRSDASDAVVGMGWVPASFAE